MKKFLIGIIFLAILAGVPVANAGSSQAPFVTIDPIGNYTLGNMLYINGTTNLPVNDTLTVLVSPDYYVPGPFGPPEYVYHRWTNISIVSTPSGKNRWSVNATDISVSGLPTEWSPYLVSVRDTSDSVYAAQDITVLPAPNVTQTPVQTGVPPTSPHIQSPIQTNPTITQSSPLPLALPIAVLAAMAIMRSFRRRKW